ncbi:MAG: phosphotransferase [Armatimonas sp.]
MPNSEILRETPWSKVVRHSDGDDVRYVKTVAPPIRHEIALHQLLARRHPNLVLDPLSVHAERGEFVLPDAGPMLRDSDITIVDWEALLPIYAALQREEAAHLEEHHGLGVPDRSPRALLKLFPNLDGLETLVDQVSAGPLPLSLNHGDLHDGNVFRGGHLGYRILDWGDASIGHPFASLRTVMVSVEIRFQLEEDDPELDRLRAIYLNEWTHLAPLEDLQALEKKVRPLASLNSALSWQTSLSCATPEEAAPFAHAVPSLIEEFHELRAAL